MFEFDGDTYEVPPIWKLTAANLPTGEEAQRWQEGLRACAKPEPDVRFLAEHLPEYDIIGRLDNQGSQGIVYRAYERRAKRHVAIKVLRDGPLAASAQKERLIREVAFVGRLQHPNIVTLYGTGQLHGSPYLVTEFIEGMPIDAHVLLEHLSIEKIVKLFVIVCRAVAYAQKNGVIHRDLKPANVMVTEDGRPKVLDFGLAMDAEIGSSLSVSGAAVGTVAYQSPEQTAGRHADVDTSTDVYALGVILYELLTDCHPFVSDGVEQTMLNIASREPTKPRARVPAISRDLEAVVLKALAKEKQRRYDSAAALADDLERYLAGEAVGAKSHSEFYVLMKAAWKFRWPIAMGTAFAAILFVAALTVWTERVRTDMERGRADAIALSYSKGLQAAGLVKMGKALANSGDVETAFAALGDALEVFDGLENPDPAAMRYGFDAMYRLAELHFDVGDLAKGESYTARASAVIEARIAQDGDVAEWLRLRGAIRRLRGRLAMGRKDWSAALVAFQEGVAIRTDLLHEDPTNLSLRSELATMLALRGQSLRNLERWSEAKADLTTAHHHFAALAVADPEEESYAIELARAETHWAVLLMASDATAATDAEARQLLQTAAARIARLKNAGTVRGRHVDDLLESIVRNQEIISQRGVWRLERSD